MLRSQHTSPHAEKLAEHWLGLGVLALATEGASKIVHRSQCLWMLLSQNPALRVELLALRCSVASLVEQLRGALAAPASAH
jgi:hypothetical protein